MSIDGDKFADAWRAGYGPSMNRVRTGELPWTKLDVLHRMTLDRILVEFNLTTLSEAEKDALNHAWHRLRPWPDAVSGLTRLKKKFIIAPLSNGNIALMTDMAKHAGLPWDCILGAELVRHYKPDREVYQSAADFLGLATGEVMMVAAHLGDLRAAKAVGLHTAFVAAAARVRTGGEAGSGLERRGRHRRERLQRPRRAAGRLKDFRLQISEFRFDFSMVDGGFVRKSEINQSET